MWKYFVSCVLFTMLPEAALNQNCMHHSLVEYFNVSQDNKLLLYTRPKKNWAEPLEVTLDFTLVSILSVVEKLQVITTYFWLFVKWNNDFVSWNASDFCNITHLTLPADKFWIPEIWIEEQANEEKSRISPFVRVSSNGEMMQFQEFHLTSSCSLNIYRFPFDKQKCNITVLSPMHSETVSGKYWDSWRIRISIVSCLLCRTKQFWFGNWQPNPFQLSTTGIVTMQPRDAEVIMKMNDIAVEVDAKSRNLYLTNGEWKFNSISYASHIMAGVEMNYSAVTYELYMQRRPVLYVLNLIFPTSALFIMDMAISCTYVSSSEKINFKITLILEVSVLSLILNEILPTSSDDPPVIAKFFSGIFLLMVVGLLENYLGMYLKEMEPPCWFLKGKSLFISFRKKKTPIHVLHTEDAIPEEGETCCNHTPVGKECAENETYRVLRSISSELQLMRKEISAQKNQLPTNEDWNRAVVLVEKVLCFSRTLFSLLFLAYIIQKWTMEI